MLSDIRRRAVRRLIVGNSFCSCMAALMIVPSESGLLKISYARDICRMTSANSLEAPPSCWPLFDETYGFRIQISYLLDVSCHIVEIVNNLLITGQNHISVIFRIVSSTRANQRARTSEANTCVCLFYSGAPGHWNTDVYTFCTWPRRAEIYNFSARICLFIVKLSPQRPVTYPLSLFHGHFRAHAHTLISYTHMRRREAKRRDFFWKKFPKIHSYTPTLLQNAFLCLSAIPIIIYINYSFSI